MFFSEEKRNSSSELIMTEWRYLWVRIGFPLAIVITVVNSITLAVFMKKLFLIKKSTYLLVNLTIADVLVGVSDIAHSAAVVSFSQKESLTLMGVTLMFSNISINFLALISLERVLAVFWPFHHRLAKSSYYFIAIAIVWLFTVGLTLPASLTPSYPKLFNLKEFVPYLRWLVVVPAASLATICFSYLAIWIKMMFFTKFRNCRTIQENSKLTKTLFLVTLVSLATWLPKTIADNLKIIYIVQNVFIYDDAGQYVAFSFLLLANSLLNVIIYFFRMPEFRKELRNTFCRCKV